MTKIIKDFTKLIIRKENEMGKIRVNHFDNYGKEWLKKCSRKIHIPIKKKCENCKYLDTDNIDLIESGRACLKLKPNYANICRTIENFKHFESK